ncbi:MAG: hypothetical protein IKF79_04355, partial [Methanosphaera sp.]|nr:hypothetical protein [Methanosphaera sp.]
AQPLDPVEPWLDRAQPLGFDRAGVEIGGIGGADLVPLPLNPPVCFLIQLKHLFFHSNTLVMFGLEQMENLFPLACMLISMYQL